ncbi:MAG TPA: MarR family winged helix-turn-helix transcriptional regulator [Candidatus Saccharimonadales bacterium]|nr:MarR family winged helix-turn-helix transcriptional regulator [Candidatus Saccharimonadales bacterium]
MTSADSISTTIHHLSARLSREADQILQEQLGLTFSQYKIMQTIQDSPRVQQRALALSLGQTEASISRQVKLLLDKQLIVMRVNPHNRRQHLTQLTVRGERILGAAHTAVSRYYAHVLGQLSDKQQSQLSLLLGTIQ